MEAIASLILCFNSGKLLGSGGTQARSFLKPQRKQKYHGSNGFLNFSPTLTFYCQKAPFCARGTASK